MPFRAARQEVPTAAQLAAGRRAGEFFEAHGRMVHALCRLLLRDRNEAEDATQQTFLSAYRSLLTGVEIQDGRAWLATIARNECFARRRSRQHETVVLEETARGGQDVETAVEQHEEVEALAAALSDLPRTQRHAVVLREFYGLSYAEVGAALGVSGPAVESLLFKGRRKLQAKLSALRVAGALAFPATLRDALAQMLPGFGTGSAAAVGGAKLVAFPASVKVAAVALLLAGGGATVVETASHHSSSRSRRGTTSTSTSTSSSQASVVRPAAVQPPAAAASPTPRMPAARPRPVQHRPVTASPRPKEDDGDATVAFAVERGNADHVRPVRRAEPSAAQGRRKLTPPARAAAASKGRALGKAKQQEEKKRKIPAKNGGGQGQGNQAGAHRVSNGSSGGGNGKNG